MHDPSSISRFQEHDLVLPMVVIEELDKNKKGMSEANRNARQAMRTIDIGLKAYTGEMKDGIPINLMFPDIDAKTVKLGKMFFPTEMLTETDVRLQSLAGGINDNLIIAATADIEKKHAPREVVLVTKDINMRIKARALGIRVDDYFNDKALEDSDVLHTGYSPLPPDFWERHAPDLESWTEDGHSLCRIKGPLCAGLVVNSMVYLEKGPGNPKALYAIVQEQSPRMAVLKSMTDYSVTKNSVWGIVARNMEQNFALNLLMDKNIDFVTLMGTAGTGKTLLTLAAAIKQTVSDDIYSDIIVTRATVPVGDDIGFLPGTEQDKMGPWMGALDDNLDVLDDVSHKNEDWSRAEKTAKIKEKIKVKNIGFMRGRTFLNKFVIIDEAQNLTPKQIKTLITRAGPGTKIVCLGNVAQIDTPYLTEGSSGLTFAVDRFKGWQHGGHVLLKRGERSRLADFANEVL